MPRIAMAQINTTVGAFEKNLRTMETFIQKARAKKADLVVFPELSITGYPPKDLLETPLELRLRGRGSSDASPLPDYSRP